MTEERLTELEIRLTHQEALIETLNDTLIEQQRLIEKIMTELTVLRERMAAAGLSDMATLAEETPPPHY